MASGSEGAFARLRARVFGGRGAAAEPATAPSGEGAGEGAGATETPSTGTGTLTPEQTAGFFAAANTEALVERESEGTIGAGAPEPPLPIANPAEDPDARAARLSERLHNWIPMAIVAVSILAAIMGWRASLADENATRSDELARQDFVHQQDVVLGKVQQVDSDVRLFGNFEQTSLLGHALLADAPKVGGTEGQSLTREGQADVELARGLGGQFADNGNYNPAYPSDYYDANTNTTGALLADGTYRASSQDAYSVPTAILNAESGDQELTSLEPDRLDVQAASERNKGVELVGVAALFIAGLVFFTLAAVSRGLRTVWFSLSGMAVAVIGLILFPIVQLS